MTEQKLDYVVGEHPNLPAPNLTSGPIGWMKENLFSSPLNSCLSLISLYIVYLVVPPVLDWAFFSADWVGDTKDSCDDTGACWVFINAWFKFLMYGRYPEAELWRVNISFIIGGLPILALIIPSTPYKKWITLYLLFAYPVICFFLFVGGSFGLAHVETSLWGGLFLTLVIGIVGIVASLPLGIVLALGRRSHMPAVRAVCVAFIELWRGVPLIIVLFMSSVMFPLFLPEGMHVDKLLRALVGVTLFSSAYMAEVIRGGLQAIPKGQYEAAAALGLSYWKTMGLIIMPQALKLVIPAIVSTFIGLFKDTTLVLIIGLYDLLGAAQAALTNPSWPGYSHEAYVFAAFVFWAFCFSMSRYSVSLERKLHTGH